MTTSYEERGLDKYDIIMKILEIIELDTESRANDVSEIRGFPSRRGVVERSEVGENNSYDTLSDLEVTVNEMCTSSLIRHIMKILFRKIRQMIGRKEFISRILALILSVFEHL
jgi:hypothetical protein